MREEEAVMAVAGRLLRRVRAGERHSTWNRPGLQAPETIGVSSESFPRGGQIPPGPHRGLGAGQNRSPALAWSGVPAQSAQLLLVIEDTDVPFPRPLIHTVALLTPDVTALGPGGLAAGAPGVRFAKAAFGRTGYHGPRPVEGHGVHHYGFLLFALDITISETATARDALAAASGHVLARGRIIGIDER